MKKSVILDTDTVTLDDKNKAVVIIDQTCLPGTVRLLSLKTKEEIWNAIYLLQVRGAPAIGVAAAFGMYVLACQSEQKRYEEFKQQIHENKEYLDSSRPTAVNLSWATKRMEEVVLSAEKTVPEILTDMKDEALKIWEEDIWVCRRIGENGLTLLHDGDGILTHCNAGKLATIRYGTATAPLYLAHEKGWNIHVYCDETRPLLQGARLSAFELNEAGIDTTLLCDNMAASLMKKGCIDAVIVGCDRVAANGDTANKIGTSAVAAVARYYGVPLYIAAPTSTIDLATETGEKIVIEQRSTEEVTTMWYQKRMAPDGIKVYNPAFDVTDHELIAGIVTEFGIARAPYSESLQKIFEKKKQFVEEKNHE